MFCFTTSGFSLTNFKSNIINIPPVLFKKILGIVKYQGVIEAGILPAKIKKEPFYPTSWDEEFRVATQIAVI